MPYDIGPKIGIDGEAEYRKQINNLIVQTKTLGTEMKVVTSEFKDNANSQEALTKKNEVLNKQIETQSKKLDLLKGMLEKSTKLYGEADTKTLQWKQTVNQAQSELNNLQSELSGNTKKLEEMESELEDTSDSLKETKESAEKAADGFTVMKGALADLVADGMETIISGAKDMVSSYDDAATKMQGQTGATAKEMEK